MILLTIGSVLGSSVSAVRAGASALASASSHAALQRLNDVAGTLSRAAAPVQPPRDLLLDERVYGLIDPPIARIGLVLQKVTDSNGSAPQFYRLPTRLGVAGLIQLPGELLSNAERAFEVGLIAPELSGSVSVAFVLTDAEAIAPTYKYKLWRSWTKGGFFREVRDFDGEFIALLESQTPEARLDTLADNFALDLTPPSVVTMEPQVEERIAKILLAQADVALEPSRFLRSLVDKLYLSPEARGKVLPRLSEDLNVICPLLVKWASGESYPAGHERGCHYTVLGALLQALLDGEGGEKRPELVDLVERYGLIRDRDILARMRQLRDTQ